MLVFLWLTAALSCKFFCFFFNPPFYLEKWPCNALVTQFLLRCYQPRVLFWSPNVVRLLVQADCIKMAACLVIPRVISVSRWCHHAFAAALGQMRC
uniref:Uncharacterized protein n=1 Tax=Rhipicephalus appendiculatus TaxID=34631 RepID=A0A131YEN3_RHIAP